MNKRIEMGAYYQSDSHGLIKTIARCYDELGNPMIMYAIVGKGGCASDALVIPEDKFIKIFNI